uniref:Uncharacterized protein n=1 Tax=Plectus sambesii TaxID=2011161 RepID=A0A914XHH7_9BILA
MLSAQLGENVSAAVSLIQYKDCLLNNGSELESCATECVGSCEQIRYRAVKEIAAMQLNETKALITLSIQSFDYPVFMEQYLWTSEQFIGALGGILGLWVGLDFVILIRWLIFKPVYFVVDFGADVKPKRDVMGNE